MEAYVAQMYSSSEEVQTLARKLGLKSYRPDFGIPELATLVEVKFIGEKTSHRRTAIRDWWPSSMIHLTSYGTLGHLSKIFGKWRESLMSLLWRQSPRASSNPFKEKAEARNNVLIPFFHVFHTRKNKDTS